MNATGERVHRAIRIRSDDEQQIKALAKQHHLSFTQYLVDSALDRLPDALSTTEQRLNAVEQRLERLEQVAYNT